MAELGLAEAAAALGVSVDTIRRRIRAGTLDSRQDERGRLLVTIPDPVPGTVPGTAEQDARQRPAGPQTNEDGQETASMAQDASAATQAPADATATLERLVEVQRETITLLTGQLEARTREVSELHVLLRQAQERTALPSPPAGADNDATYAPIVSPEASGQPRMRREPLTLAQLVARARRFLGV